MLNIALVYGAIAGTITIGSIILGFVFGSTEQIVASEWLGYLVMVLALSLIFFGVKRYRDRDLGGFIKFVPALLTGIGITIVAGIIYVLAWEAYMALTGYTFMEDYSQGLLADYASKGATPEELAQMEADLVGMAENYANPLFRMPVTFIEIFPVGLVVSLVSAVLLRNPNIAPARGLSQPEED